MGEGLKKVARLCDDRIAKLEIACNKLQIDNDLMSGQLAEFERARSITLANGDRLSRFKEIWYAYVCDSDLESVSGGDAIQNDDGTLRAFPTLAEAIEACNSYHADDVAF